MAPCVVKVLVKLIQESFVSIQWAKPLHHILILLEKGYLLIRRKVWNYRNDVSVEEYIHESSKEDKYGHKNSLTASHSGNVPNSNMRNRVNHEVQSMYVQRLWRDPVECRIYSHSDITRYRYSSDPCLPNIWHKLPHRDPHPGDCVRYYVVCDDHLYHSIFLKVPALQIFKKSV